MVHSHAQSIAKLESQMGQLANSMNKREEGKLPSQVVNDPKGKFQAEGSNSEQVQAVMIRGIIKKKSRGQ